MKVKLAACGNPDLRQGKTLPGVRARTVKVSTYAEASAACMDYIAEHNLGAGNWAGGAVTDDTGKVVARVSYNGRVWPPAPWYLGQKPIW